MSKVDQPEYRGTVRVCPSCEGNPVIRAFKRRELCETCFNTGVVHIGIRCEFCGRSVQYDYNGVLACGTDACKAEAEKKLTNKPSESGFDDEAMARMYGLVM